MTTKIKRTFSQESITFRQLSRDEKFRRLLKFCETHKKTPSISNVTEEERVIGQFYTNAKTAMKTKKLFKSELAILDAVNKYHTHGGTRLDKITRILEFCKKHNRTPIQSSKDSSEKKLGQVLNTLKNRMKQGKLKSHEIEALKAIEPYRSNYQRSREEKLTEVLAFCELHGRTPRQHVANENENRLAVFLSTIKAHGKENGLSKECIALFDKISTYFPSSRSTKLSAMLAFCSETKKLPTTNSNSSEERRMATFFTKMKGMLKKGTLGKSDAHIMQTILSTCEVKTRADKITDLVKFIEEIGRLPKHNSDDSEERKFAIFYNNTKQIHKKGTLNNIECKLFERIHSAMETAV